MAPTLMQHGQGGPRGAAGPGGPQHRLGAGSGSLHRTNDYDGTGIAADVGTDSQEGSFSDWEANEPGFAVPQPALRTPCDVRLGALSISEPSVRIAEQSIAEHGVQVLETAHAISESPRPM